MSWLLYKRNFSIPCDSNDQFQVFSLESPTNPELNSINIQSSICDYEGRIAAIKLSDSEKWYIKQEAMRKLSRPIVAHVDITNKCNLECKHCYVYSKENKNFNEESEYPLKIIETLITSGIQEFEILGGEPFLCKDFFDIVDLMENKSLKCTLFTNGTLISEQDVIKLEKIRNLDLFISLEGPERVTNEIRGENVYQNILKAIRLLLSHKIAPKLSICISTHNRDKLITWFDSFSDLNKEWFDTYGMKIDLIRLIYLRNRTRNEDFSSNLLDSQNLRQLRNFLDNHKYSFNLDCRFSIPQEQSFSCFGCLSGITECAIDSCGNMLYCSVVRDKKFGNILKEDFQICWKRLQKSALETRLNKECITCRWFQYCFGKCEVCSQQ